MMLCVRGCVVIAGVELLVFDLCCKFNKMTFSESKRFARHSSGRFYVVIVLCALILHSGHFALIFPLLSLWRKAARLKQTAWSRPTTGEVVHNGVEYPALWA